MKNVGIVVAVVLLAVVGYFVVTGTSDETLQVNENVSDSMQKDESAEGHDEMEEKDKMMEEDKMIVDTKTYALADVSEHKSEDDCWFAIEGKVYDVTEYIEGGLHPGEEAILMGCGRDATDPFNDRPNGSGAHSQKARSFLTNFYIGDLEE